ncbi:UNVERIFIED_CONTAM: hypothetical protein FKN15_032283 [Acipenser sinensis]
MQISCRRAAGTGSSCRGISALHPYRQSAGCRGTGRKSADSSGLRTTSTWPRGATTTRCQSPPLNHSASLSALFSPVLLYEIKPLLFISLVQYSKKNNNLCNIF